MIVFAARNVFNVAIPDAALEDVKNRGNVFAEDDAVAEVEVGAEHAAAEAVDEVAEFGGPFDEEAGLALDADADFEVFGGFEDGGEGFAELFHGGVGGHGGEGLAAGDADVVGADGFGEVEGVLDHADAVGAEFGVGGDQGGFEEGFGRGVFPVAEGAVGVDVADSEVEFFHQRRMVIWLRRRRICPDTSGACPREFRRRRSPRRKWRRGHRQANGGRRRWWRRRVSFGTPEWIRYWPVRKLGRFVNGGGRIRTLDTLSSMPVFKTGAFNRSATPPG